MSVSGFSTYSSLRWQQPCNRKMYETRTLTSFNKTIIQYTTNHLLESLKFSIRIIERWKEKRPFIKLIFMRNINLVMSRNVITAAL